MSAKTIFGKEYSSETKDFAYFEFEVIHDIEETRGEYFARVLGDGREVSHTFSDDFIKAKCFILGALFTLDGLRIINAKKEL